MLPSAYASATDIKQTEEGAYQRKVRNDQKQYCLSAIRVPDDSQQFTIYWNDLYATGLQSARRKDIIDRVKSNRQDHDVSTLRQSLFTDLHAMQAHPFQGQS